MRAKKGNSYVFTEPGINRLIESSEDSPALELKEPFKSSGPPAPPEKLCPHGGVYFNDIPQCGLCFRQAGSGLSPEQEMQAFLISIYRMIQRLVKEERHWSFRAISQKDKIQYAFSVLIEPKNLPMIQQARNPHGRAWDIADKRLLDLYRKPVYWNEWSVSQLKFPEEGGEEGDKDSFETNGQRLQQIEAPSITDFALEDKIIGDDSVRYFPGVKLLWTRKNVQRLIDLAREGMNFLPERPLPVSDIIEMRAGSSKKFGAAPWTWEEIANFYSPAGGRQVSVRQVSYAFSTGAASVRRHILRSLTPVLGEIMDRKVLVA